MWLRDETSKNGKNSAKGQFEVNWRHEFVILSTSFNVKKKYGVFIFNLWNKSNVVDDLNNFGILLCDVSSIKVSSNTSRDNRFKFSRTILKQNFFIVTEKNIGKYRSYRENHCNSIMLFTEFHNIPYRNQITSLINTWF